MFQSLKRKALQYLIEIKNMIDNLANKYQGDSPTALGIVPLDVGQLDAFEEQLKDEIHKKTLVSLITYKIYFYIFCFILVTLCSFSSNHPMSHFRLDRKYKYTSK